jgi:hypothetical protein
MLIPVKSIMLPESWNIQINLQRFPNFPTLYHPYKIYPLSRLHPETGEVITAIINKALYFRDQLHSVACPDENLTMPLNDASMCSCILTSLLWLSGWGLRLNIPGYGFNAHPGDQYFVLVSGQLAEKLPKLNAWWKPLEDGKMVPHILISGVCVHTL